MEEYVVDCEIIEDGIVVSYPENFFTDEEAIVVEYKITEKGISYNDTNIPCQNFCKRPVIAVDILIKLGHRNLTVESLYNKGRNIYSFLNLIRKINIELSEEDSLKEIELVKLCLNPSLETSLDISYGYDLILDLFACEGINV